MLIGSIGAVVILLLAGVTPIILAQQTTEIIEKPKEATIEEKEDCSICSFSALSNEEIVDQFTDDEDSCYDICSEIYMTCIMRHNNNCALMAWLISFPLCLILKALGFPVGS